MWRSIQDVSACIKYWSSPIFLWVEENGNPAEQSILFIKQQAESMLPWRLAHVEAQQSACWHSNGETQPVTTARKSVSYKKKRAIVKLVVLSTPVLRKLYWCSPVQKSRQTDDREDYTNVARYCFTIVKITSNNDVLCLLLSHTNTQDWQHYVMPWEWWRLHVGSVIVTAIINAVTVVATSQFPWL